MGGFRQHGYSGIGVHRVMLFTVSKSVSAEAMSRMSASRIIARWMEFRGNSRYFSIMWAAACRCSVFTSSIFRFSMAMIISRPLRA